MKKLLLSCILVAIGSTSAFAQNTCAAAINITANGTITAPTINGTYVNPCLGGTQTNAGAAIKAIWYKYTPTSNGEMTISSNLAINTGTTYSDDTRVSILKGTCGAQTCVDYDDDVSDTNYLSSITVPVASGTTYYIEWDNYWVNKGFQFTFNFVAATCIRPGAADFYLPDNITTTSADVNWNQAIGAPADYDVDWSTTFADAAGTGTIVSGPAGTLAYATVSLTGLPESLNFRYYVRSHCSSTDQSAWQGPYFGYLGVTLPYSNDFENVDNNYTDGFIGFSRLSTTATSTPASYADGGDGVSMYTFNSTTAVANRWAYSRAISLVAGEVVTIGFKTRLYPDTADAMTMDVTVGAEQRSAVQTEVVGSITADDATQYVPQSVTYTAPADGIYFFGFHNNSPIGTVQSYMFFDTLDISSVLSNHDFISSKLSVFPNPAANVVNITNDANATISTVEMTDLNGRVVKSLNLNATGGQVSINDLSAGVYMMNIKTDKGTAVKKVVKE